MMAEKTGKEPAEIMKLLQNFGLGQEGESGAGTPQPKKLQLTANDIREPTEDELRAFCDVKEVTYESLIKFNPYMHRNQPWMMLPAYNPKNVKKACGWLRCHVKGEKIKVGDKEIKYPIVAGSQHGLFGVPWLVKKGANTIIFTEAWRDMCAAIAAGYVAVASSGGASTWYDSWLAVFKDLTVHIVMDADKAGVAAAQRAAEKIHTVAKEVKIVTLPYEVQSRHGKDLWDYLCEN